MAWNGLRKDVLATIAVAALPLAGCGTNLQPVAPWVPADDLPEGRELEVSPPPDPRIAGEQLRIVTWNIRVGTSPEEVVDDILANPEIAGADLYFLQEVERFPDEESSVAAQVAALLGLGHVFAPNGLLMDGEEEGIAIMSPYPLTELREMDLPQSNMVLGRGRPTALGATVDLGNGRTLAVANIHLDTRINLPDRILQLRPALLNQPAPFLAGGDLNSNDYQWAVTGGIPLLPGEAVADVDPAEGLDAWVRELDYETPTSAVGNTWHGAGENQRLDSLFTLGLSTMSAAVVRETEASDHWPVWLDVQTPD